MVIILDRYGNHSNRLIQNFRIRSFCKANKIRCCNFDISDMEHLYDVHQTGFAEYLLQYIIRKSPHILRRLGIDLILHLDDVSKNNFYKGKIRSAKLLFVNGWELREPDSEKSYLELIRKKYALKSQFYCNSPLYQHV